MNRLSILLVFITFCNLLNAQIDREFWFAVPKETSSHGYITKNNNVSFKIAALDLDAVVRVSMPANPDFIPHEFTVRTGTSYIDTLAVSYDAFDEIHCNPTDKSMAMVSGKSNRGFYITSSSDITVYYDYDNTNNSDLFSLKGQNALGIEFYTPFQSIRDNHLFPNQPYSSIDIVASEDGTIINVDNPSATPLFEGQLNTFSVSLNRGECYSIRALSRLGNLHLGGTHISSNKPIAVTGNDDSLDFGPNPPAGINWNMAGDQLVPVSMISSQYVVMSSNGPYSKLDPDATGKNNYNSEQIFVLATENNTVIKFFNTKGALLYTSPTLMKGQQDYYAVNSNNPDNSSIYIVSTDLSKHFYVWQLTCSGYEISGAIIPPISDCTGTSETSIYRSDTVSQFALNLMIPYDDTKDWNDPYQPHNYFILEYNTAGGKSSFNIPGSWFEPNVSAKWAVLKNTNRQFDTSLIPCNQAIRISNNKDFFHLGVINGNAPAPTNKYGYFSLFSSSQSSAGVVLGSAQYPSAVVCFGDTVLLKASGGLGYTWHYGSQTGPPTYLSDSKSATPKVICPAGIHRFYVTIQRPKCFNEVTFVVSVFVQGKVRALFETDKTTGCAPFQVHFFNTSTGANKFQWSCHMDSGAFIPFVPLVQSEFNQPATGFFQNSLLPYKPIVYTYKLLASYNYMCSDTFCKQIVVYPNITAELSPKDTIVCSKSIVKFNNLSTGDLGDTLYQWHFGDGNSSFITNPLHVYENTGTTDSIYKVSMIATSPYNCKDTSNAVVMVHPYFRAEFSVDSEKGCSPFTIKVYNNSLNKGAIGKYLWNFGDSIFSNNELPVHTYLNDSTNNQSNTFLKHYIKLLASTADGLCISGDSVLLTVYPLVKANFGFSPEGGKSPLSVQFTNHSVNALMSSYVFGDGARILEQNPINQFLNNTLQPIDYSAKLIVISNYDCVDSIVKIITVLPNCKTTASFTIDKTEGFSPLAINFTNTSINASSIMWNFGDQLISDEQNPSHEYASNSINPVDYQVKLVTYHPYCSSDSVTKTIHVLPDPESGIASGKGFDAQIYLYPNPVHNNLNFKFQIVKTSEIIIELLEPSGNLLKKIKTTYSSVSNSNTMNINLESFNQSILFVKVTLNDKIAVFKILKQ